MSWENWCKHYNGVGNSDKCKQDIVYEEIRSTNANGEFPYICRNPNAEVQCEYYALREQAEIDEVKMSIAVSIKKVDAFWTRETEICPQCGVTASGAEQIGRCVYAVPCRCRIGQGRLHQNWKA